MGITYATVTVTYTGSEAAFLTLLDTANAHPEIQVMKYSNTTTDNKGSVTLNVYMAYSGTNGNAATQ